jgi:hypothetical protein
MLARQRHQEKSFTADDLCAMMIGTDVKRKTHQRKEKPEHKGRSGSKKDSHLDPYAYNVERKVTTRSGKVIRWK